MPTKRGAAAAGHVNLVRSAPVENEKSPSQVLDISKADGYSGVEVRSIRYLTLFVSFFGS